MGRASMDDLAAAVAAFVRLRASPGDRWLEVAFQHALQLDARGAADSEALVGCMQASSGAHSDLL